MDNEKQFPSDPEKHRTWTEVKEERQAIPERLDARGYPMPRDGWTCYHCGETFTTWGSARDHFGESPCDIAACKIKVGEERGLVMEMRRAQKSASEQLERALEAERDLEAAQCQISSLSDAMRGYKPFRKCNSIYEVFCLYDSMEGRALSAEEKMVAAEQRIKDLIQDIENERGLWQTERRAHAEGVRRARAEALEEAVEACSRVGSTVLYVPQRSKTGIARRRSNYVDCQDAIRALAQPAQPILPSSSNPA